MARARHECSSILVISVLVVLMFALGAYWVHLHTFDPTTTPAEVAWRMRDRLHAKPHRYFRPLPVVSHPLD